MDLGFVSLPGIPGMRMVIFSLLLIVVVLFYREGIMGRRGAILGPRVGNKGQNP